MLKHVEKHLVDGWKDILKKSWMVRLATVLGFVSGYLGQYEAISIGLLNFLPPGKAQTIAACFLGFMTIGVPMIFARLLKQKNLPDG